MTNFTSLIAGAPGYLGAKILNYLSKAEKILFPIAFAKRGGTAFPI